MSNIRIGEESSRIIFKTKGDIGRCCNTPGNAMVKTEELNSRTRLPIIYEVEST